MMRKVFLPFFLAIMLLPGIVLAQSITLPKQGEKSRNVTAPGLKQAADQDWIILPGGQAREFKADAGGKLHFPVRLTGVNPEQISLKLRDVRLGQRGDMGLRDYFVVPDHVVQDPQQGPAIEVVVNLDKEPPQGSYDLLIEASTAAQPRPRDLEFKVVHPAAKLKPIDKVVLQTTKYSLLEPKLVNPSLSLTETSGNSRLKPLKLVKPIFSGVQGEVSGGGLDFPDFPSKIPAGENVPLNYKLAGDFPLGSFTGNAQITSPQLAEPFTIQFEVKKRLASWIIILLLISGLLIGWLSRTYLTYQVELDKARIEGGRVLAQMAVQTNRIPDQVFAERLQAAKTELEAVLTGSDPKPITEKATEANQKLRDALKDFDERRAQVQVKLVDFIKLFDTPWSLPPVLQAVLTKHRNTLTEAQNKLAAKDVDGARCILLGKNQAVSGGLESDLREDLMTPVSNWKVKVQDALGILGQPNLPLPAPIARSFNEGVPLLNSLLAKVDQIQPQDQMPQILAVVHAVHDVQANLRSVVYLVYNRLEQTRRQFNAVLSLVPSVNQADLKNLTDEIDQFLNQFMGAIPDSLRAVDMLNDQQLRKLDGDWTKFLRGLTSSLPNDDKKTIDDKTASREYVDAALKFAELSQPPQTRALLKKGTPAAGSPLAEASPWIWFQQTLFPAAVPQFPLREELPPALASFLNRTFNQLARAQLTQTIIFGVIIVGLGYFYFQEKFVGTPIDLAAVFLWGFSLDVSMATVLEQIKTAKLYTP